METTTEGSALRWAVGTIIARNYLSAAHTLVASLRTSNPGAPVAVLVVDAGDDADEIGAFLGPDVRLMAPSDLALEERLFLEMASIYDVTELSTALKPWLLETLLLDSDVAIYLDPDIQVYGSLSDAARAAYESDIALTPHVLEPIPRDGLEPTDVQIMAAGIFNLGFIAVGQGGKGLLAFWQERLRRDAISAQDENLFTDQRWIDNVPALFRHTVLRDEAYNVAYWNVYQRKLELDADGTPTVHGRPVVFFHFSGYSADTPWRLTRHYAGRPRVVLSAHPALRAVCDAYGAAMTAAALTSPCRDAPYGWAQAAPDLVLTPPLRRYLRRALVEADRAGHSGPPLPLDPAGPEAFLRWLRGYPSDAARRARINRAMHMAWLWRGDVQHAYPDVFGVDADAFRGWCEDSGVHHELRPEWVDRTPAVRHVEPQDVPGANVAGYFDSELGVGQIGRVVVDALRDAGMPVATATESSGNRANHPFNGADQAPVYPVSIFAINADEIGNVQRRHPELVEDRHRIGVWSWELEQFPGHWDAAFGMCDEIWASSDFARDAIRRRGHSVPVHTLPVPMDVASIARSASRATLTRGAFGVPDDVPLFLFSFDCNSVLRRKNPLALIEAFERAFPDGRGAHLLIKVINSEHHREMEEVRVAAAGSPGITVYEGYLDADEVPQLYRLADCYVSLHRSEGFGLTVAEAMACGLPVICSAYSAVLEFLDAGTARLVQGHLAPVGEGAAPYDPSAVWFEPDVGSAAAHMRWVADNPAEARALGEAGRRAITLTRDPRLTSQFVAERLAAARETWRARRAPEPQPPAEITDAGSLENARSGIWNRIATSEPHRLPGAPALRRMVLRALDHYDRAQRHRLNAVVDAVEAQAEARRADRQQLAQLRDAFAAHRDTTLDALRAATAELAASRSQISALQIEQGRIGAAHEGRLAQLRERAETATRAIDDAGRRLDELAVLAHTTAAARDATDAARGADRRAIEQSLSDLDAAVQSQAAQLHAQSSTVGRTVERMATLEAGLEARLPDLPGAAAVVTDVGPLLLPAEDTVVLPWLRQYGSWEQDELRLVLRFLPAGGTLLDIGAHVGYYTVAALRRVGPTGTVLAVEPDEDLRRLLEANVESNVAPGSASRLTVLPYAAWHGDEQLDLTRAVDGNSGDNRVTPAAGAQAMTVPGRALSGEARVRQAKLDVVKVDIQGRDHLALKGLGEVLLRDRPHVVTEFWPDGICSLGEDPAQVLALYRAWGYEVRALDGDRLDDRSAIERAGHSPSGFLSLWLDPQCPGADG